MIVRTIGIIINPITPYIIPLDAITHGNNTTSTKKITSMTNCVIFELGLILCVNDRNTMYEIGNPTNVTNKLNPDNVIYYSPSTNLS